MAGVQIRMDYAATMRAASGLSSVSTLVSDAQSRHASAVGALGSWEGSAASKGKLVMAKVSDVLRSYNGAYFQFARFFVSAAEQFSSADERAASTMSDAWGAAYGSGSGSH